jgi:hypothetical protein
MLLAGYDVYRSMSQHSEADLICVRGNEMLKIDVKSALRQRRRPPPGNIHYLLVNGAGECELVRASLPPPRRSRTPTRERRARDHRAIAPRSRGASTMARRAF